MVLLKANTELMESPYTRLKDILPLETPLTLMIDPANMCNFRCTFCPTGDYELLESVKRPIGMMDFDLFCKIIDDLAEFPEKVKSLRLYKDGEPFLNRNIVKMIVYAKKKDVAEEIYIISNGSAITENIALGIIEAGLDRLRISIEHVNSEKYKEITRTYSNYEMIVKNVRFLYQEKQKRKSPLHINAKIVDTGLSKGDMEKFENDFGNITDSLNVETLMGWSKSMEKDWTLGSNPRTGIDGKSKLKEIQICPQPFKGLAINFDGTASVCCVDWSHGTIVGDLKKESLMDIWNGPKLREFRLLHLMKQRHKIPVCANCQYIKGHNPLSHLDNESESLIKIYSNGEAISEQHLDEIAESFNNNGKNNGVNISLKNLKI